MKCGQCGCAIKPADKQQIASQLRRDAVVIVANGYRVDDVPAGGDVSLGRLIARALHAASLLEGLCILCSINLSEKLCKKADEVFAERCKAEQAARVPQ